MRPAGRLWGMMLLFAGATGSTSCWFDVGYEDCQRYRHEGCPDTGASGGGAGWGGATTSSASGGNTGSDVGSAEGLDVCVLNQGDPTGPCVTPATLDFGQVPGGTQAMRVFRIGNDTGKDVVFTSLAFTSLAVNSDTFAAVEAIYQPDPQNPGSLVRLVKTLPALCPAGTSLSFEITYTSHGAAGPLPAVEAVVHAEVAGVPVVPLRVPMVGDDQGCAVGTGACDPDPTNGCETDLTSSPQHCNACGAVCAYPHAAGVCNQGTCEMGACHAGFGDCDGNHVNGCEADLLTSTAHCGVCTTTCSFSHAGALCDKGVCKPGTCNPGYGNCDGNDTNGCETSTTHNTNHCGFCGNSCQQLHGSFGCSNSTCVATGPCEVGYDNCDGIDANGCESHIAADPLHCGGCNTLCNLAQALPACSAGACTIAACQGNYADCDKNPANGCEVNTQADTAHCGGCNHVCSFLNAAASCVGGVCKRGGCAGNFADCDSNDTNGCEVNLASDANHCGSCSKVCPMPPNAIALCQNTACAWSCKAGYVNLDGNAENGCEYACVPQNVTDLPDDGLLDTNCDGIDGDASAAVFVDAVHGSDTALLGTRATPMKTITGGLALAQGSGKTQVYVSEGTYGERVVLVSGVSIYGGYSATNGWARKTSAVVDLRGTVVNDAAGGRATAMEGANLLAPTTVDRLTIETLNTTGTFLSNYALVCSNCAALTIKNSTIAAGAGAAGTAGSTGSNGVAGGQGGTGSPGDIDQDVAPAPGGSAGVNTTCGRNGGSGGPGAYGSNNGTAGSAGVGSSTGGAGGTSGKHGGNGDDGTDGANGANGANGSGGSGGTVISTFWFGAAGGNGTAGQHGNGGGGGGGGGGQYCLLCIDGTGNGGGGGGAGGCAATGGTGGTAGGGSFGLFLVSSNGIQLVNNSIASGKGGTGGAGGMGGTGGTGGAGGVGASVGIDEVGAGGDGGAGGRGGNGGNGGGGAGGVSFAIYRVNSAQLTATNNTLTHGIGGKGGTSSSNVGADGASGVLF